MLFINTSVITTLKMDLSYHPSSDMIYLTSTLIFHQEVLLLVSYHNIVNIIRRHISPSKQITAHVIMPYQQETGLMFGSSVLA